MTEALKQKFLNEAIRIGEELLKKAKKSEQGTYWETMSLVGSDIHWRVADNLYSGSSGIALFFLELYKKTKEEKYLKTVIDCARWLENHCEQESTDYYAFFTGRMGVSYFFVQLSQALNEEKYLKSALKSAQGVETFLDSTEKIDDLINGISGTILGLMHLHAATQDESLIAIIEQYTTRLIERASLGPEGLYWDRSNRQISGLCGFSHGAGGIGYVFLEMGRYFGNETFYGLAEEAFKYENHHFNDQFGNWPDLRKAYYNPESYKEHVENYKNGNRKFFETPGNMMAWCHGSPGIGLSRLRAHEILGKEEYFTDLKRSIQTNQQIQVEPDNYYGSSCLCHGHAGNAMLFVDAYRLYQKKEYWEDAVSCAEKLLDFIKANQKYVSGYTMSQGHEDTSLFMGNAGVGLFFLSMYDYENTCPILKPDITSEPYTGNGTWLHTIKPDEVKQILLKKFFPLTSRATQLSGLQETFNNEISLKEDLFSNLAEQMSNEPNEHISALYAYESILQNLDDQITSDSWVSIKRIVDLELRAAWLNERDDEALMNCTLKIEELSALHASEFDCLNAANTAKGEYFYLLNIQADGIKTFELSEFSYDILQAFKEATSVEAAITDVSELYGAETEEERQQVRANTILQAQEAIKSGVLDIMD